MSVTKDATTATEARHELLSAALGVAAAKVQFLLLKFDPDQPRSPDGRWVLVGDGQGYKINILEEDQRGGHTYEKHVGKSQEYLLNRVRTEKIRIGMVEIGIYRAGSFPSVEAANNLTSATLSQNQSIVEKIASGELGGAVVDGSFNSLTGYEAYKSRVNSAPYIRDTVDVETIIKHDKTSPNGLTVVTSFPFNQGS